MLRTLSLGVNVVPKGNWSGSCQIRARSTITPFRLCANLCAAPSPAHLTCPHMTRAIDLRRRTRCLFTAGALTSSRSYYAGAKITRAHPQVILRIDDVCVSNRRGQRRASLGWIKHKNRALARPDDDDPFIAVCVHELVTAD
jgi:hypothetical protein